MSRLLNKVMSASCFGGLILLVASGAHAEEVFSGDHRVFNPGDILEVGVDNFGSYTINDGTTISRGGLAIGVNPASSGQASVTGSGTTLLLNGREFQLGVGAQGTGQMTIAEGAVVDGRNAVDCTLPPCISQVGGSAGSNGSLIVTDPGSQLLLLNALIIGNANVFTDPPR